MPADPGQDPKARHTPLEEEPPQIQEESLHIHLQDSDRRRGRVVLAGQQISQLGLGETGPGEVQAREGPSQRGASVFLLQTIQKGRDGRVDPVWERRLGDI